MQQLLQDIRKGELKVAEIPLPMAKPGEVLIANACSLVSAGTEKMVRDLARKSLFGKAKERPDHVRRVLEKIRNEGFLTTVRQVLEKLDEPMAMGYSSAGTVLACGAGVQEFKPGDRVASNGPHAEVVCVPKHLCARIPDGVGFDRATFTVIGSIAMQGVRLSKATLGETVFVIGLGLVGQIAVSLLSAAGCRVIGTDLDESKCELAIRMGAEVARSHLSAADVESFTGGLGADAVLITAATKSNGPIDLAANAVRRKGRVVLVGVVGLELDRRPFYFKEAEFVVSCSYGPGRYDPEYEERGHDYPAAYVRWTEQRNMQAVLDLMATKRLDVSPLISHRFDISNAEKAYQLIESGDEPYLGILLQYSVDERRHHPRSVTLKTAAGNGKPSVGVLGAGNFARMVLLPALRDCNRFHLQTLCSAGGVSASHSGEKIGFSEATTDEDELFRNQNIDAVFSITRHDQHAGHVLKAVRSDKHIFVEKPLCLSLDELDEIEDSIRTEPGRSPVIMVGFNRRFSPAAKQVKSFFENVSAPRMILIRFNAGAIPVDHWIQDESAGGGRIIGEACHAIDLATYLAGSPPVRVFAESVGGPATPEISDDQCFITLRHANGSISQIAYSAGGDKAFPKERVEMFGGGQVAVIDDFRSVTTTRNGRTRTEKMKQDKGHRAGIEAFANVITEGGVAPIPWEEIRAVTSASILAVRSIREGTPFEIT